VLRRMVVGAVAAGLAVGAAACGNESDFGDSAKAQQIADVVGQKMEEWHVRAALVKVTQGGRVVSEQAFGPSMTDVPATTDMNFRNGAVAFAYVATLLLRYVDQGKVALNDTIERWEPDLPNADRVTLLMLTNQTTGYPDFETDPGWNAAFNADPFHVFTYEERIKYAFERPLQFEPGANWSYAHTNFMILGHILEQIGGKPLDQLLEDQVFDPMGLRHTVGTTTAAIPDPVLHTFSSERRAAINIPKGDPFYEEATFWNTQWGTPMGANETTTLDDLITSAVKIGTGAILSEESFHAMTDSKLIGFGKKETACEPSCFTQIPQYNYGLGVVRSGDWIIQNPLLSGLGVVMAYLPQENIAIAVAATLDQEAFGTDQGNYPNRADYLFREIGAVAAPDNPPPPLPPYKG
jgi:CubicO group peptidase (beta-lactamase class C family)